MISDVHVTGLGDPAQDALIRFLDGLRADVLWVLGDLFHAGWAFGDAVHPGIVPTVEALRALRDRGVELGFVPGNHDFGLASVFWDALGAQVLGAHVRRFDGVDFLLAHGDEADTTLGYVLLRRLLRGQSFDRLIQALGVERGSRVLHRLAGASREAPASQVSLVEAQRRWATRMLAAQGARYAVLGHSHALGVTPLPMGALFNLGDWRDGPRWLEVNEGVPRLMPG